MNKKDEELNKIHFAFINDNNLMEHYLSGKILNICRGNTYSIYDNGYNSKRHTEWFHVYKRLIDALSWSQGPKLAIYKIGGSIAEEKKSTSGEIAIYCTKLTCLNVIDVNSKLYEFAFWCADRVIDYHKKNNIKVPERLETALLEAKAFRSQPLDWSKFCVSRYRHQNFLDAACDVRDIATKPNTMLTSAAHVIMYAIDGDSVFYPDEAKGSSCAKSAASSLRMMSAYLKQRQCRKNKDKQCRDRCGKQSCDEFFKWQREETEIQEQKLIDLLLNESISTEELMSEKEKIATSIPKDCTDIMDSCMCSKRACKKCGQMKAPKNLPNTGRWGFCICDMT